MSPILAVIIVQIPLWLAHIWTLVWIVYYGSLWLSVPAIYTCFAGHVLYLRDMDNVWMTYGVIVLFCAIWPPHLAIIGTQRQRLTSNHAEDIAGKSQIIYSFIRY